MPAIAPEGISKVALMQLQALLEKGYTVKLLVLSNVNKDVLKAFAPSLPSDQLIELRQQETYLSVTALKGALGTAARVKKVIASFRADVVLAHAPYAHFILRLAKLFPGMPVWQLWAYFHFPQYQEFPLNSFRRRSINLLNRWLAKRFDAGHISVSDAVKEDISQNLIRLQNHHVIYNALPLVQPITASKVKLDDFTIVVPGRVESIKGQSWFLDVFYTFSQSLPNHKIKLIFAGGGSQQHSLQEQINMLGLIETVHITGNITSLELQTYLTGANLVVIPSLLEGFGVVVLEALQLGKLVLSSDAGGLKEIVEDGRSGILFRAGNKSDCLAKLQAIYQSKQKELVNPEAVNDLLQDKFSFSKHMQQLISLIENAK